MNNGISPALFARVLGLPDTARVDLLQALGEAPIKEAELDKILTRLEVRGRLSDVRNGKAPA